MRRRLAVGTAIIAAVAAASTGGLLIGRTQARKTVEQALAYAEALPPGQRSESAIESLKKQLDATVGSK